MKAITSITAGLLALAFVGTGSAQTIIRITGSTAFRAATLTAVTHILPGCKFGYVGPTFTKSTEAIFTSADGKTIVKTSFAGSVGGIADLTKNLTVGPGGTAYPNGAGGWLVNSTPQSTGGTANVPQHFDPATTPDVAMSDSYQKSTPFTSPALKDTLVGVIPFVWVKSIGNSTTVTIPGNFTPAVAKSLLSGALTNIHTVGRDEDSGTHCISYIFAGLNPFAQTPDAQYQPSISGGHITGAVLWPGPVNVDGITYPTGHSGYASGGTLATTLNTPTQAGITTGFVGYLGVNDAASVNGGHNNLQWNGVSFTPAAVQKGQYNFWGYEHLLYRTSFAGAGKTVADALAQRILNFDAAISGVIIEPMAFHRTSDGGPLLPGDE